MQSAQPAEATFTKGVIPELDGLRGLAISLVTLHHFWPREGPWAHSASLPHLGWIGVDLFFVISGFLICGILLDTKGQSHYFRNFWARRALRIFPLYYICLTAFFVFIPLVQGGPFSQTPFVAESGSPLWYYLYAGNLREAWLGREPAYVLAILWSLCIEEQFYLLFPFAAAFLERKLLTRLLLALVIAAPLWRWLSLYLWPENPRVQYLFPLSRADVISLGCLLAIYFRSRPVTLSPSRVGAVLAALVLLTIMAYYGGGLDRTSDFGRVGGYSLVALTFAALVLWAVLSRGKPWMRFLAVGPLKALGKISYGVYLLQRPAEVILGKALNALSLRIDPDGMAAMGCKWGLAILLAALSWRFMERPIIGLKRHFSSGGHPLDMEKAR